jgi:hypothetical protein
MRRSRRAVPSVFACLLRAQATGLRSSALRAAASSSTGLARDAWRVRAVAVRARCWTMQEWRCRVLH